MHGSTVRWKGSSQVPEKIKTFILGLIEEVLDPEVHPKMVEVCFCLFLGRYKSNKGDFLIDNVGHLHF